MRRRKFITLLGATAFTWPLEARAQQSAMPLVGLLCTGIGDAYKNIVGAFREGLKQTGYIEGQNVAIEYRWANNEVERLPGLASDLVYRQVAVIFAIGPPAAGSEGSYFDDPCRRRHGLRPCNARPRQEPKPARW